MSEFALAGDLDKPGGFKLFQVMGKRGGGNGLALAHIRAADAFRLGADLPQNFVPPRIG